MKMFMSKGYNRNNHFVHFINKKRILFKKISYETGANYLIFDGFKKEELKIDKLC